MKSPMNYIGNKYKFLSKFKVLFPKHIDTMVDLFCGGCDITFNIQAKQHIANDINTFVLGIYKEIQRIGVDKFLDIVDENIAKYNLTKDNKDGFLKCREDYNRNQTPTMLYTLMCFSFNNQPRFNNKHEYNSSFGKTRSTLTDNMRKNFLEIGKVIQYIHFTNYDFSEFPFEQYLVSSNDFLYADPPYLIANAVYNDGRRGFKGWNEQLEAQLLKILKKQDERGIKFALSNVLVHRGLVNEQLQSWIDENNYHVYQMHIRYDNCSYNTIHKGCETKEVLITNYKAE